MWSASIRAGICRMKKRCFLVAAVCFTSLATVAVTAPPRFANPGAWLQKRAAPANILKRGERAMNALDLEIAPDGSVTRCDVVLPSRSVSLDDYACAFFKNNAHFEPSPHGQGLPRSRRDFWTWEASKDAPDAATSKALPAIKGEGAAMWVTTDDLPKGVLSQDQIVQSNVALTISAKGQIIDCKVTLPSEKPELDTRLCALLSARARYKAARDKFGNATEGVDWITIRWQIPRD